LAVVATDILELGAMSNLALLGLKNACIILAGLLPLILTFIIPGKEVCTGQVRIFGTDIGGMIDLSNSSKGSEVNGELMDVKRPETRNKSCLTELVSAVQD